MTGKSGNRFRRAVVLIVAPLLLSAAPLDAADLQAQTAQNYERYVALTEAQADLELAQPNPYLWFERLPEARRLADEQTLRRGDVIIERLETLDNGQPIPSPGALIHHWIGTIFAPGATLAQTLAFMQDYGRNADYFKPNILRSNIVKHEGDDYFVQQRFYKKKIISSVIDVDEEVHYHVMDSTHAWSRSHTTRVQEIDNPGHSDERPEPEGHDKGFVWKMNTLWRFEERDGGTYMECQAISLSRDLPAGLGWIMSSLVSNLSKDSLNFTLTTSRSAIAKKSVVAGNQAKRSANGSPNPSER